MEYRKRRKKKNLIILALVVILLLPLLYAGYAYISFNVWLTEDSVALESYPMLLVKNGKVIAENDPWDKNVAKIDDAIIKRNSMGRLVVLLSRSEIKYNLFRTRAYIKIFLETALPNDSSRTAKVKALNTLVRNNGKWHVKNIQDISIE